MKGESKAVEILPLVGEVAEGAARAGSVQELVASLAPLLKQCGYVSLLVSDGAGKAKGYEVGKGGMEEVSLAGSAAAGAIAGGKAYIEKGITKYSGFYDERRLAGEGYGAYACLPLRLGNGVAGAICAAKKGESFAPQEITTLSIAANIVAISLSRITLGQKVGGAEAVSQALLSKAAEIVLAVDIETGRITGANSGAGGASGYSRDELVGMGMGSLFEGLKPPGLKGGMLTLTTKSGGARFIRANTAVADAGGKKTLVITGEDVTEKAAEETNYREIVESIPDIVFALDSNGIITSANDEMGKALGRLKQSLVGAPLGNIVSELDYKALGDAIQDLRLGSGTLHGLSLRLLTGEGKPRWFELNGRAHYDPKGRLIKIIGVLRDVHDMRQTAENEELFRSILANPNIAVLITDAYGHVTFMNKGAEELFGYTHAEMRGRDVRELYPENKKGELDMLIRILNEKGRSGDIDTVRLKKGGEAIPVVISATTVLEDGKVCGYMEIIKDLRQQRELKEVTKKQQRLEKEAGTLKEIAETKSVFVSSVSHELRTPLTNIHGYSALLSEGMAGRLNEEQTEYVRIIHAETDRLTKLINDLLDLSRMEKGKFKLSPVLFKLEDLEEKCSCSAMAEAKGLYVRWEVPPDLPDIYGDPNKIAQVLINLISNGIKFTESGGVTVSVSQKSRTMVQVDVADTGPGISDEDKKRLFKPFSQIPRADGQKKEGTGLGLAISKEIVRLHNGRIWVESEPGKGAKFSFLLRTTPKKERMRKGEAGQPVHAQQAQADAPQQQEPGAEEGGEPPGAEQALPNA